jgi:tRNA(fMet)-specific endonuclease VapC
MNIVVDTDVVSFLFKNHPIGKRYDSDLAGRVALISFMTVAEVEQDRPPKPMACPTACIGCISAQDAGRRTECADAWIAATAMLYDAPLVTHNRKDYLGVPGLSVVSHSD